MEVNNNLSYLIRVIYCTCLRKNKTLLTTWSLTTYCCWLLLRKLNKCYGITAGCLIENNLFLKRLFHQFRSYLNERITPFEGCSQTWFEWVNANPRVGFCFSCFPILNVLLSCSTENVTWCLVLFKYRISLHYYDNVEQ